MTRSTITGPSTESLPGELLEGPVPAWVDLGADLWGFGGLHGGLSLSLLTAAMHERVPDRRLRQVTGQFHRAVRGPFALEVTEERIGRTATSLSARAIDGASTLLSASAVFAGAVGGIGVDGTFSPSAPPAPPPEDCPVFTIPPEFVPFARHTEIRPVGPARPFTGADEPELVAWLRLAGDETPPDETRLVVLMDSLAPSYAAVLTAPVPIPTVALSVRPGPALAEASSPWVLLRARTLTATADGWVDEALDAWAPDGSHLGSGHQLRLVTG